jgi:tetraacyldisaccharide 4'-kinase
MSRFAATIFNAIWYSGHWLKWVLWVPSQAFRLAVVARRALYRHRWLRSFRLSVPVVVVGNISVGGTGKTPCIIWLAQALKQRGLRVGVVTRAYGGDNKVWPQHVYADSLPQQFGDEPVLIAQRTGCPVGAGPDRVAAAKLLLGGAPLDVILSDDGLQHYRMDRVFEIAVVDGIRGLGNGWCLPGGPLREPPSRLNEVDAVIVNSGSWGHTGIFRAHLLPLHAYHLRSGAAEPMEYFKNRAVHAVAGIGHPQRFFDTLRACGMQVDGHPLPDHADIAAEDLMFDDSKPVMITEKDAVKCKQIANDNVWCVVAQLHIEAQDEQRLMRLIMRELDSGA